MYNRVGGCMACFFLNIACSSCMSKWLAESEEVLCATPCNYQYASGLAGEYGFWKSCRLTRGGSCLQRAALKNTRAAIELWQVSWFPQLCQSGLCPCRDIKPFQVRSVDCMQTSSKLPTSSTALYSVNCFTAAAAPRSPPCRLRNT